MIALDYLLLQQPQWDTAAMLVLYAALSLGFGRLAGRVSIAEALAVGFLVVAGAADLAMYTSRALNLPINLFLLLALTMATTIAWLLRRLLPTSTRWRFDPIFFAMVALPLLAVWIVSIVMPDPSAGLSSHHGWIPLYAKGSFEAGRLLRVEDMQFGQGYMTSIFYIGDLNGLTLLAGAFTTESFYPAYFAGGILAGMSSILILAHALRDHRIALVAFCLLTLAFLRVDGFYRLVLASNWGDKMQFLVGATMCFYMVRGGRLRTAALAAATISTFVAFPRPYGGPESLMVVGLAAAAAWFVDHDRKPGPWLIVLALLAVFSLREVWCILVPPSPYYPGSTQLATARSLFTRSDMLNDLGLLTDNRLGFPQAIRGAWVLAFAALALMTLRRRHARIRALIAGAAPLALFLPPIALEVVTGYRTGDTYSKVFILALFVQSWYPCLVISRLVPARIALERWQRGAALAVGLAVFAAGSWAGSRWFATHPFVGEGATDYFEHVFASYRGNNADYVMARALKKNLGDDLSRVAERPIVYFYYEPGLAIRHFIGGDFMTDWDFYSDPMERLAQDSASLGELVAKLGYPSLYFPYGDGMYSGYRPFVVNKFKAELADLQGQPWVEAILRSDMNPPGTFVLTRNPNDAGASQ
ncbi:hypothetical protein [Magnetospirillum aberrantis]|uniref:Glycosyltransferase RgtA/B/C/D-like domain-containing protein n=1 Tax=Magnetospirillum aberrantis SpK TaxID=908842 RepID=A0A7C9UYC3_9PROT|nr:hypothetical protein [Magnetospirillum aberrantis]NFV79711.1 hypothetical protein [Magnetospirillum aberrantis SpK]